MKLPHLLFCGLFIFLWSCNQQETKNLAKESSGKINYISVFIDNQLWKGEVGDSLRAKFASAVDGLPMEEPLYSMKQYDVKMFEGFMTNSRLIIFVEKTNKKDFKIIENKYAKPQKLAYIQGTNVQEIIEVIEQSKEVVLRKFKQQELAENQRRIKKSLLKNDVISQKFDINLMVSSAYNLIINEEKFIWLRKELPAGNSSLLVYEVPLQNYFQNYYNPVDEVIKMRDSVGQKHIEGKLKDTYMITEESYAPYQFKISMQGKNTFETKGIWVLKDDFMSGPFIHYAIIDEPNNRVLCLEGFCYNPQASKRDLMFELEAMIKSIKFNN